MVCGLLGKTLGHSYSPMIHSLLGNYSYLLFEKSPEALGDFLRSDTYTGLNVTIPYKKAVVPYCTDLSDVAKQLGSVNTLVRTPDGRLWGHNTDYFGFSWLLKKSGLQVAGKKVLVLGTGGASVTVQAVLRAEDARVVVISRTGPDNYENLQRHRDASVIVNATPVGMYPGNGIAPVSLDGFSRLEGVLDLIYNPCRTQLLLDARKKGCVTANGLWMLVAQAKESAQWFMQKPICDDVIAEIYEKVRREQENIILIGMPGCGKSSVGCQLARLTGRTFADSDTEIEKRLGMPIPDFLEQSGEEAFRSAEQEVLADLGKQSGLVIATGGGCVTVSGNYPLLHQNGTIVWLQRDLGQLPVQGRPLSQRENLSQMYQKRRPMYKAFADLTVVNSGSISDTAAKIWEAFS